MAFLEDSCTQLNSAGLAGLWRKWSGQCTCHFSDPRLATRLSQSSAQTYGAVNCVGAHRAGTE